MSGRKNKNNNFTQKASHDSGCHDRIRISIQQTCVPKDSGYQRIFSPKTRDLLFLIFRIVLGGLFVWASIHKIRYPFLFLATVYDYEIVSVKFGIALAVLLPGLELLVGICLMVRIFPKSASLFCVAMLSMFLFAQISVLMRGLTVDCGCFGIEESPVTSQILARTGLMLGLAILVCVNVHAGGWRWPRNFVSVL